MNELICFIFSLIKIEYINYLFLYFAMKNNKIQITVIHSAIVQKYGKFPDIYKQMGKFFVLRCRFADLCFAFASQTTRLQDYKTTSGCRMMLRYRFADYKSTRLQDYKTATASLVVSLTRCLVVWRSNAKLNFRDSVIPTIALRQQCSKIKSISYSSNGLLSC